MPNLYPPLPPRPLVYSTFVDKDGLTVCTCYHSGNLEFKPITITDRETIMDMLDWLDDCWTLLGLGREDMTTIPMTKPGGGV